MQEGALAYLSEYPSRTADWDRLKWGIVLADLKDYLKSVYRRAGKDTAALDGFDDTPSLAASPEDRLAWEELLAGLPEKESYVLFSIFYEGKTLKQVAEDLGVSMPTIQSRRDKGLERLARIVGAV